MANTRETMGEQACLDALVANTLTSFEDDGVTKVGANCLSYHTALTDVKLPQCKSVEYNGLADCTALTTVDMQGTGTIAAYAFGGDTALAHLILRGGSKTTLANTSAFTSTPISLGNGAVYVPSDQLAAYKADNNWKNYFITTLDKYPLSSFDTITESWAELNAMTQEQIAAKYSVGDTKLIDLGTEGKVYAQIAGFGHDDLASGTGKAKVTFITKGLLNTKRGMDGNNSYTVGGWAVTAMRSYLTSDVLPLMPSDLQAALKEVTKYSAGCIDSSTIDTDIETTDKLFLPSALEVGFTTGTIETNGAKYDIFTDNNSRIKRDQSGSAASWWLRSGGTSGFRGVDDRGVGYSGYAYSVRGFCLGFCI